jgi:hypothetical protein
VEKAQNAALSVRTVEGQKHALLITAVKEFEIKNGLSYKTY